MIRKSTIGVLGLVITIWLISTLSSPHLPASSAASFPTHLRQEPTPTPEAFPQKEPLEPVMVEVGEAPVAPIAELGEGPFIRLAVRQFDPLLESAVAFLPAALTLETFLPEERGYYIVQFHSPVQPAWKEAMAEVGAQVLDYVPDFAFVVAMDRAAKARVEAMPQVRWVGIYQPGYRIAPALLDEFVNAGRSELVELIVVTFPGADLEAVVGRLRSLGGTVSETSQSHWKGKIRVQADSALIGAIASISGVEWIEAAPQWQLFNNVAVDIMGVRPVWDTHGLYGAGQVVAVCDTGLDRGTTNPAQLHDDFEDGRGNSRVLAIFDRVGDVYHRAMADSNLGEIALTHGRLDEALAFYQEALRSIEQIGGSVWMLGVFHNNLGHTFIRRGQAEAALEHLRASQKYFEQIQARDFLPELHRHLAEATLLSGQLVEAEAQGRQALGLARELSMQSEAGNSLRVLGEIAAAQGRLDEAVQHLSESISIFGPVGDEYEGARSQLSLAKVYAAQGKPQEAAAALDLCAPVFERLEAALDLAAAQALREKIGGMSNIV